MRSSTRPLDTDELRQPRPQLRLRLQFDEQRQGELARLGDERVVDVELALHLLVGRHLLGADHLLNLEEHRRAVLEHDRDERADLHAAHFLQRGDFPAELARGPARMRARSAISSSVSLLIFATSSWRPASGEPQSASVSRPFVNRPAWLFSARASVSSHSATSSKPSSRAVRAKARVHLGVLVGLTGDGRTEIVSRAADRLARHGVADGLQKVEVTERVAGLSLGDRAKQGSHVRLAFDVGGLREVQVTTVGLALAGERHFQICFRLAVREFRHDALLVSRLILNPTLV